MKSLPGKGGGRLGRYELLARLATGGMGEIFLARLEGAAGFEKLYVIKRVLPHLADDPRFRVMLIDEARIAAKMSHPNICQVFELGEDAGQLFIAMEYLEGVTLLPVLRRASRATQPLPVGMVVGVLQQTCDGLHYAHELNERDGTRLHVVHRDVTPANLFLTENGTVKVLDFGIAKAKDASANTQDGTVKGKYAYMAPEQLRSEHADRRVDVFALAIVGFEMLALRRLFQRKTDYLTFRAVMELPIPNLREFRPDLPTAVADVFGRALERDPAKRFPTARHFASALQDATAAVAKSWSSSEIGDYVQLSFEPELSARATALAIAVQNRAAAAATATLPVLASIDAQPRDGEAHDEPDDFPSIEGAVHALGELSTDSDATGAPLTELSAMPMGALGRAALPRQSESVVTQVPSRRGFLWPILAAVVVGAGALALWFMWKQIKSSQQPPVVIYNTTESGSGNAGNAVTDRADATPAPALAAGSGAAPDAAAAGRGVGPTERVPRDRDPVLGADKIADHVQNKLAARMDRINGCVDKYRDTVPDKPSRIRVTVATNGSAKASVEPAAVNASPLGDCIRRVAQSITFSRVASESTVSVQLKSK